MVNRERLGGRRVEFHQRGERHLSAGERGTKEELVEGRRIRLQFRRHFNDDLVLTDLGVELRDLALAKGTVEEVVDSLRLNSKTRSGLAIDFDAERRRGG